MADTMNIDDMTSMEKLRDHLVDALDTVLSKWDKIPDKTFEVSQRLRPEPLVDLTEEDMANLAALEDDYNNSFAYGDRDELNMEENYESYIRSRFLSEEECMNTHDLKADLKVAKQYLRGELTGPEAYKQIPCRTFVPWLDALNDRQQEIFLTAPITELRMHVCSARFDQPHLSGPV
jgi:hypothetical protein